MTKKECIEILRRCAEEELHNCGKCPLRKDDDCTAILKTNAADFLENDDASDDAPAPADCETLFVLIDEEYNVWTCENCRTLERFEADGPQENGWRFCPKCGQKITGKK